jgi:predicted ATPase
VAGLDALELHPEVTFLVGENGSGKSTLLAA